MNIYDFIYEVKLTPKGLEPYSCDGGSAEAFLLKRVVFGSDGGRWDGAGRLACVPLAYLRHGILRHFVEEKRSANCRRKLQVNACVYALQLSFTLDHVCSFLGDPAHGVFCPTPHPCAALHGRGIGQLSTKSVHIRLAHSRGGHGVFLGSDLLNGCRDRRLIVEV
jgi:hypothetical protein